MVCPDLAQREGFEPSCGFAHKLISSQPRYDRFDTAASIFAASALHKMLWEKQKQAEETNDAPNAVFIIAKKTGLVNAGNRKHTPVS